MVECGHLICVLSPHSSHANPAQTLIRCSSRQPHFTFWSNSYYNVMFVVFSLIFTSIKRKQLIKNLLLNKVAEWGCHPQKNVLHITHPKVSCSEEVVVFIKVVLSLQNLAGYIKIRKVFHANCKNIFLHSFFVLHLKFRVSQLLIYAIFDLT